MNRFPTYTMAVLIVLMCTPVFAQILPASDIQGRLIQREPTEKGAFEVVLQVRALNEGFNLGYTFLQLEFETDKVAFSEFPSAGKDYQFMAFDTSFNPHYDARVYRADKRTITIGVKLKTLGKGDAVPMYAYKDVVMLRFKPLSVKARYMEWYKWSQCHVRDDMGEALRKDCDKFAPRVTIGRKSAPGADAPQVQDVERPDTKTVRLGEAYPNPFNPQTRFSLQLENDQPVHLAVYDMNGRLVQTLHDGVLSGRSTHHFTIDGSRLTTGTYLYRVMGRTFIESRRVTLLK